MRHPLALLTLLSALALPGCGGGARLYPDTDVPEVPGFDFKGATGVQKSAGSLQQGTLEYQGSGDMKEAFREFLAAMKLQGWSSGNDEITDQKATGVLRKDSRICSVEFSTTAGVVKAIVKVGPSK